MITLIVTLFRIIKEIFKTVYKVALLLLIVGVLTTGIDYTRVKSGETPLFNVKFYKATRKVRNDPNEPLVESSKIKFKLLNKYPVDVPSEFKEVTAEYAIETKEVENCQETSKLYYADEKIKVYTYCIESFQIKSNDKKDELINLLKEQPELVDEVDSKLAYIGLLPDGTTQKYLSYNDESTNNGLAMFKCNNNGITDIYFGPRGMQKQYDFCTYKDDDFKFMYTVEELEHEKVDQVETFYEDLENYYQFTETKSDYVIIKTPAVRGKEEQTCPLKTALAYGLVTIDELKEKGLEFNVVSKNTTTAEESNS